MTKVEALSFISLTNTLVHDCMEIKQEKRLSGADKKMPLFMPKSCSWCNSYSFLYGS
jgi:hypothetical protein